MAKYAIVENGFVTNVIEADEEFVENFDGVIVEENEKTGIAFIGGKYEKQKFSPKEMTQEEIEEHEKHLQKVAQIEAQILEEEKAKASALAKLAALGLTAEEAAAIAG